MNKNLIEIKRLTKLFPSQKYYALKNLDLSIPKGSIFGLIGMSGAGKSTLLRCLVGLEKATSGEIYFDGVKIPFDNQKEIQRLRKQMGMVFQHFYLFSSRTVEDNIAYPLEIAGIPQAEIKKRVNELLLLVGLEAKRKHYPSQLSGGEKQRVGIARALATHPPLLLCDEPTSALDPKTTQDILQLLISLNKQLGITIVIITHQLETVKQACQKMAVLADGQIVEVGETQEIFTHPCHPKTRHLLHYDGSDLPQEIKETMKTCLRLGFKGRSAKEPIISQLIKTYGVDVNILSGGLDCIQEMIVGHLFVEISGAPHDIQKSLDFLRGQKIACEEMQ